mgnify:FL=1
MTILTIAVSTITFSLNIATTINPYYLIVKEITAGKANVSLVVRPGADPHSYSPTVSDVKALSKADLIVANGLGLDNAYLKGYKNVLYLGDKIPATMLGVESGHTDDELEGLNPHIWLSFDFLINYIVPSIRDELIKVDKVNAQIYKANAQTLINSLSSLSKKFDSLLSGYKNSVVVLDHPSYFYLFRKYDILILSVEEGHDKQPTISHIKDIIAQSKKSNLLGIFVGPQFNRSAIETISKELKRRYYVLDPLGVDSQNISELFNKAYSVIKEAINGASEK